MERINYSSGAPLEAKTGYSRMVKVGNIVMIGGTTAVQPDGSVFGENAYEQAKYIFEKQVKLLAEAGASASDVVKVNGFITDMAFGKDVAAAFTEFFFDVKPLFTMVGTPALNRPTQFVELDLTAIIL